VRSAVLKRSIVIAGHKTSVSLEDEFWESPKEIAGERGVTFGELVLVRYQRGARDKTATDVRLGAPHH
jgi:predicted DNA-binding ribbon-helix-helix protein